MYSFYIGLVLVMGMSVIAISGTVFSVSLHANIKKGIDYGGKFIIVGLIILILKKPKKPKFDEMGYSSQ